jgi:predicted DNA binding protein
MDKSIKNINFETYHDSCWRYGTERIINEISEEIEEFSDNNNGSTIETFEINDIKLLDIQLHGDYDENITKIIRN